MANTFFIGDTHFGHTKCVTVFTRPDGSPLRDFDTVEDMDEHLVQQWNSVVRQQDTVYHVGDVVMSGKSLSIIDRLNGNIRLVLGNHDVWKTNTYAKYFQRVYGSKTFSGFIATHIPVHPSQLGRFGKNVHGHLHANNLDDPRYMNVSCEQVNYTPISLEEIRAHFEKVLDK